MRLLLLLALLLLLGIGIIALGTAFYLIRRRLRQHEESLARTESHLSRRILRLQGRTIELDAKVREMSVEPRHGREEFPISAETRVADLVRTHPHLRRVLARWGLTPTVDASIGGETLREICETHALDTEQLVDALRRSLNQTPRQGPSSTDPDSFSWPYSPN